MLGSGDAACRDMRVPFRKTEGSSTHSFGIAIDDEHVQVKHVLVPHGVPPKNRPLAKTSFVIQEILAPKSGFRHLFFFATCFYFEML